ncbi:MAG: cytochrome bd ubiquinol oxidase subunit [Gaiellales bacterium]|jgi:cytochrome d ubiquinol oxidase subunit II|nr:cytochrome bd ubiquinol oxidase subunit [Gaiellales bacterium]
MRLELLPLVAMMVGLAAYAVFGGADFGVGFWQLTAGRGKRADAIREHAQHAIATVWEANHVWLIFVLTVCWTAYPVAFSSIASTLAIPLFVAAVGIVIRGTTYVLRDLPSNLVTHRLLGTVFSLSSLLTPFSLGTIVGAIAAGRVPVGNARGDLVTSWLNPTAIAIGLLSVITAAFLAAVFLTADADRTAPDLVEPFRRRALASGVVAGIAALAGLLVVRTHVPSLWSGLTGGAGLAAVVLSAVSGLATILLLATRRYGPARLAAAIAVAGVVAGWPLAQRPRFLPGLTIAEAAASRATLVGLMIAIAAGALVLFPSLALLFRLLLRGAFDVSGTDVPQPAGPPAPRAADRGRRVVGTCTVIAAVAAAVVIVFDPGWITALGLAGLGLAAVIAFTVISIDLIVDSTRS